MGAESRLLAGCASSAGVAEKGTDWKLSVIWRKRTERLPLGGGARSGCGVTGVAGPRGVEHRMKKIPNGLGTAAMTEGPRVC